MHPRERILGLIKLHRLNNEPLPQDLIDRAKAAKVKVCLGEAKTENLKEKLNEYTNQK